MLGDFRIFSLEEHNLIPPYMEVTTRDNFTKTLRVMLQLSKDYLKIYMRSLKAESELELAVASAQEHNPIYVKIRS